MFHASCVARGDRGLMIFGPSGYGKSRLALDLIAMGADLVADDRTIVREDGIAFCPPAIAGRIEMRGMGILKVPHRSAPVIAAIDLGKLTKDRVPSPAQVAIFEHTIRFFHKPLSGALASALWLYLGGHDFE